MLEVRPPRPAAVRVAAVRLRPRRDARGHPFNSLKDD